MLYKYYSPQPHNFEAVINGKFYFSKVCKLNDPFDSNFKLVEPYKEFLRKVPIAPNADKIIGNYGTCSFSEEANNKHLWALYTDSYKGFVIEYNKEKLEEISNIISAPCPLHPVDYRKELLCLNDVNAQFELEVNGEIVSSGTTLFCAPKHYAFLDPELEVSVDGDVVTVHAKNYAKSVSVETENGILRLDDNFVDMEAGSRTFHILPSRDFTDDGTAVSGAYRVRSIYETADR